MKNIYTIISAFLITSLAYTMLAEIDFTEEFDEVEFFDDFDEKMTEKKAKKSIGYYIKNISLHVVSAILMTLIVAFFISLSLVKYAKKQFDKSMVFFVGAGLFFSLVNSFFSFFLGNIIGSIGCFFSVLILFWNSLISNQFKWVTIYEFFALNLLHILVSYGTHWIMQLDSLQNFVNGYNEVVDEELYRKLLSNDQK